MMRFHILTLFPDAFRFIEEYSVLGRAVRGGLVSLETVDIREYATDRHGTADDYQFGGGPGMVMKPDPVFAAVEYALADIPAAERAATPVALTSPQGDILNQSLVNEFASAPGMILICGHYAGVDERIREGLITHEVSIGDYVLTGGGTGGHGHNGRSIALCAGGCGFRRERGARQHHVRFVATPTVHAPRRISRNGRARDTAVRQPRRHRALAATAIPGTDAAPAA